MTLNPINRVATHLLLPVMILVSFFILIHYEAKLPTSFWSMTPILFYLLSIVAIGVSWYYNRSRFIFILLPLITLFWAMNTLDTLRTKQLLELIPLIVPLHLLFFLFLKERGLFTTWGALKVVSIIIEMAVIYYLITEVPTLQKYIDVTLFQEHLTQWTRLSDLSVLTSMVFFTVFVLFSFLHFHIIYHTAFIGIFLLVIIGLHHSGDEYYMALAFLGVVLTVFGILLKESYRLAFYDELTSLPGRRALMEDMAKLGRKYSLAMVDIDHFKKFNDTYGHDTGDDVLKMVAGLLSKVEGGGKAYRYGGEEFTILFPSKELQGAFRSMDRLREDLSDTSFTVRTAKSKKRRSRPQTVSIHISSGVVEKSDEDHDPMAVMKRADNALYKAKKKGRNMVVKG